MLKRLNTIAPYAIAFTLPLGFYGAIGVGLAGLYALFNIRAFLKLGWTPVLFALPFATITILSAALSPDPSHSLPPALGMALLFTIGLQAARLVAQQSNAEKLLIAFLSGTLVLALSVVLDFAMGWNRLPSGLFRDPSLHNWAGTLFAVAFPLALHFLLLEKALYRYFAVFAIIILLFGTVLALSWVGLLGLLTGALALGLLHGRALAWATLAACVLAAASYGLWKNAFDGRLYELRVRGHSLAQLEYVVQERLAIFREGVQLALVRPWLGWGSAAHHENLAEVPGLAEARAGLTGARGANLLWASEALEGFPWWAVDTRVIPNAGKAPDGQSVADLLVGAGIEGQRIQQIVPASEDDGLTYTFSVWARTQRGQDILALSIREPDGSLENVASLNTGLEAEVVGTGAVRFQLGEDWQRLWLTSDFYAPPETSILAVVVLDGYHTEPSSEDRFYVWGAQVNEGAAPLAYEGADSRTMPDLRGLSHFHNWFVQTLFETGLLGLATLLGLLAWLFTRTSGPLGAALLAFLTTQFFDYVTLQTNILLCILLISALGLRLEPTYQGQPVTAQDRQPTS